MERIEMTMHQLFRRLQAGWLGIGAVVLLKDKARLEDLPTIFQKTPDELPREVTDALVTNNIVSKFIIPNGARPETAPGYVVDVGTFVENNKGCIIRRVNVIVCGEWAFTQFV
jgi:hypothetical protein